MYGPKTVAADSLHAMKYREKGEDFREAMGRIAFGLKDDDSHYHQFREILLNMRFLPAGRVQLAIGSSKAVTAHNCYVMDTIEDSFVDGENSIMAIAQQAASTLRQGGGVGFDFSTLRPRGSLIKKLGSISSGPLAFMEIYDAVGRAVASAGHRRGAMMAVLRCDHPDIVEFVLSKQNNTRFTGFNISVAITDAFMEALYAGKDFDLGWDGQVFQTINAVELWERIMRATYDYAEPGVIFIDKMNSDNNLWYCETIASTNPCSEQPLAPNAACLLGSVNLVKYLHPVTMPVDASGARYSFDFDQLENDLPVIVRALDNVIDRSRYPLPKQKAAAVTKRRMGIGITGLANTAEALGFSYGSAEFLSFENKVLENIKLASYWASVELAKEKGAFPLFDEDRYGLKGFASRLPDDLRSAIKKHGIRNSHLTSIAPTGTISMTADNISSGLEPVFAYSIDRPVYTPEGRETQKLDDYGVSFLGIKGKLCDQVTAEEHVNVLVTAQNHIDSAVSKTVNMDGNVMSWDDFKGIYETAYKRGAKGCATFNKSGKRFGLLAASSEEPVTVSEGLSCEIGPDGRRDCA